MTLPSNLTMLKRPVALLCATIGHWDDDYPLLQERARWPVNLLMYEKQERLAAIRWAARVSNALGHGRN